MMERATTVVQESSMFEAREMICGSVETLNLLHIPYLYTCSEEQVMLTSAHIARGVLPCSFQAPELARVSILLYHRIPSSQID